MDFEINDLKKEFYKSKVTAELIEVSKAGIHYSVLVPNYGSIGFLVPLEDMGDAHFTRNMPAKHLIRYIIK